MSESANLNRLKTDWVNQHSPEMVVLRRAVLGVKGRESYQQTVQRLISGGVSRRADNVEYVAGLLALIDDGGRTLLQVHDDVGLSYGHLWRVLDRAGVDFYPGGQAALDEREAIGAARTTAREAGHA